MLGLHCKLKGGLPEPLPIQQVDGDQRELLLSPDFCLRQRRRANSKKYFAQTVEKGFKFLTLIKLQLFGEEN